MHVWQRFGWAIEASLGAHSTNGHVTHLNLPGYQLGWGAAQHAIKYLQGTASYIISLANAQQHFTNNSMR